MPSFEGYGVYPIIEELYNHNRVSKSISSKVNCVIVLERPWGSLLR